MFDYLKNERVILREIEEKDWSAVKKRLPTSLQKEINELYGKKVYQ